MTKSKKLRQGLNVASESTFSQEKQTHFTDASPYPDADIVGISDRLVAKEIFFNAIITGDCTNRESWNNIP
jgi:hypothetical protein